MYRIMTSNLRESASHHYQIEVTLFWTTLEPLTGNLIISAITVLSEMASAVPIRYLVESLSLVIHCIILLFADKYGV